MTLKKTILKTSTALSLLLLNACGSETEEQNLVPATNTIAAYNKLATAPINTFTSIDLASSVSGVELTISDIYSDTPEKCFGQTNGELGVNVEIYEQGRCDYTYVAEDKNGNKSKAKLILMERSQEGNILTTMSKNLSYGDEGSINLTDFLGSRVTNYKIQSAIIQDELGAEPLSDFRNDGNLTFRFTAPESLGWHIISYELSKNNAENLIGEIFVSVTDGINQPPKIVPNPQNPENDKEKYGFFYTGDSYVLNDEQITIDLANIDCVPFYDGVDKKEADYHLDLPCLTISDELDEGDEKGWQLTNVKAFNSDVTVILDDMNNTAFTFMSESVGYDDVSYTLVDRQGATSMGVMRIFSETKKIDFEASWEDAILYRDYWWDTDRIVFEYKIEGPTTHLEAMINKNNYAYEPDDIDVNSVFPMHQVSIWTKDTAEGYCEATGRKFPSKADMDIAFKYLTADTKLDNWPKNKSYFVETSSGLALYDFNTQQVKTELTSEDEGYIACEKCTGFLDDLVCNWDWN